MNNEKSLEPIVIRDERLGMSDYRKLMANIYQPQTYQY